VREAADVFVVAPPQPITPDHLRGAFLAAVCHEAKKKSRRVIVSLASALVERAARQFDEPVLSEHRIGRGEITTWRNSIDALSWVSKRMLGTPSLTVKVVVMGERVQNFRCRQPERRGSSGKPRPKSITGTIGPPSGFNISPRPSQKSQVDQADGSDEQYAPDQKVASSPNRSPHFFSESAREDRGARLHHIIASRKGTTEVEGDNQVRHPATSLHLAEGR
jgi:hypothetical protein